MHRGAELGPEVRAEDAAARWDPDLVHAELAMSGLRLVDDDIDATLLLYVSRFLGVAGWGSRGVVVVHGVASGGGWALRACF